MPNHETNHVVIVGTEEKIRTVLDEFIVTEPGKEPRVSFEAVAPPPANLEQGGCGGGAVNGVHANGEVCWYEWNVANWGTKWGAYSYQPETTTLKPTGEGHLLYLIFETAWSAPTPVFAALEEKYAVKVHAWTEDEGGWPPQVYGEPDRYLEIGETKLHYDESIGEYGEDREPTAEELAAEDYYSKWEVELR